MGRLLRLRAPALAVGTILGVVLSFVVSGFEEVLAHNVRVAFFIPFIVYMASAVGMQTQAIYIRDLKTGKAGFMTYLFKETILGAIWGIMAGVGAGMLAEVWLGQARIAMAVGLSMFAAVITAPFVALVAAEILQLEHWDPVGAGPIATVIQDAISIVIYGSIASRVLLG